MIKIASEDFLDFVYRLGILFLRNTTLTRSIAQLDLVVQTSLVLSCFDALHTHWLRTSTILKQFANKIGDFFELSSAWVRSEIQRAVMFSLTCGKDPRKVLIGHTNPRIALVIFQKDVISRSEFFDKVAFKKQSLRFAAHNNEFDVGNLPYKNASLRTMIVVAAKVRQNSVFEIFSIAYINNVPLFVEVLVHSGRRGKRFEYRFYARTKRI